MWYAGTRQSKERNHQEEVSHEVDSFRGAPTEAEAQEKDEAERGPLHLLAEGEAQREILRKTRGADLLLDHADIVGHAENPKGPLL